MICEGSKNRLGNLLPPKITLSTSRARVGTRCRLEQNVNGTQSSCTLKFTARQITYDVPFYGAFSVVFDAHLQ